MTKETVLRDFFMSLKVALKNAAMYNPDHPAFKKSIAEVKEKVDAVLEFLSPLELGFTPRSIQVENSFWDQEKIYQELGRTFHFRKIKKLRIIRGVALDELMLLMAHISLPPRDIFKKGGIETILEDKKISRIRVEELDYSQLLQGEGEEIKDVWTYLLQEAVEQQDSTKMIEVADSFEKVIEEFEPGEFLDDKEFSGNFIRFFSYLRKHEEGNYRKCARNLVKSVVKNKKDLREEQRLENIRAIITDLKEEDLASTLWEEILTDDNFDSLSFSIFSKLIEKERHDKIATSLSDIFKEDDTARVDAHAREKIQSLLSSTSSSLMSEIYRETLSSLLKEMSYESRLSFDPEKLRNSFHYVLLNLLKKEKNREDLLIIIDTILEQWEEITKQKDYEYLQHLHEAISQKDETVVADAKAKKILGMITGLIEIHILEQEISQHFDYFINAVKESTLDVNTYLEKIFTEKKISPFVLKAFFKFFKEYLFYFNLNLAQSSSDTKFLERIIKNLKDIDSPISYITLKNIYPLGNAALKYRVLKAMQSNSELDERFLSPILKGKEPAHKAEALVILMRNPKAMQGAFEYLFQIDSPFGMRNKRLIEHIQIVETKDLKQAKRYLQEISLRKNFWNKKLRVVARRVLERWDAKQN